MQRLKFLLISASNHFVGQFRDSNETYFTEEDKSSSILYIYRSSDQPQNVDKIARGDKTLNPEEVEVGPKASFQFQGDPSGFICPMKFTVDRVLHDVSK